MAVHQPDGVLGSTRDAVGTLSVTVLPLEEDAHEAVVLAHAHQRPALTSVVRLTALDRLHVQQFLRVLEHEREQVVFVVFRLDSELHEVDAGGVGGHLRRAGRTCCRCALRHLAKAVETHPNTAAKRPR